MPVTSNREAVEARMRQAEADALFADVHRLTRLAFDEEASAPAAPAARKRSPTPRKKKP